MMALHDIGRGQTAHLPVRTSFGVCVLFAALAFPASAATGQLSERDQHAAAQHFKRGMEALLSERYEPAEREFKDAVAIDPLYDAAFYGLGQVYMATRQYEAAVKAYVASRDAFKAATSAEALSSAASDRRLRDQIDTLRDNERNMVRQMAASRNPAGQAAIDQIHEQVQQLESRKSRRAGATAPPVPAGLSMALGSAYFRLNDIHNAEREYRAAIEVNPSFGEAHSNLAVVYLMMGRAAEADAEVKAAEKAGFKVNPRIKEDIGRARR